MSSFIEVHQLEKKYHVGQTDIFAIRGLSFVVEQGEFAVILGPSGCGKSTLLNILGGMDVTTSGSVTVDGQKISEFNRRQLNTYRRTQTGFVFQFYNLLPNLTAKENIDISCNISLSPTTSLQALAAVGLSQRANHFPSELSGGEQQRVSIARAVSKNPKLLLCDEPTGALDSETGKMVLITLHEMCKQNGQTVIIVTHNQSIAKAADRVIHLRSGKVVSVECNANPTPMNEVDW